ncbi:MAG: ATP-binding protein [Candidatus Eremiobacteraeota bacterium]|nr:ATP-binding protein [Candidatus Eremiobacteraeota bacterium]
MADNAVRPARDNPFRTAPGSEPPALVGRDEESSAARYSLNLTESGAPAQPIVFTGLRGMGKTALLRHCIADPSAAKAIVVYAEASASEPIATTLQRGLERARRETASLPQRVKSGFDKVLEVLPRASFELPNDLGAVSLSGRSIEDAAFVNALEDLNEATRHHGRHLVFAIDEIQDAPVEGLRDLVRFVHATASTKRPVYVLAAGLPGSRQHLHQVRTYTERWRYFRLDLLTPEQTKDAIAIPARERRVTVAPAALDRLAEESAGYPFFVQEYASAAWLAHQGDTISEADVERAIPGVRRILEDDFYDARFRLLTPRECSYVLVMADLGPGPHTTGEIASRFGTTSETLSSIRYQLVKKDVIYSPMSGMAEFRIPLTERYVLRHKTELERRARESRIQRRP